MRKRWRLSDTDIICNRAEISLAGASDGGFWVDGPDGQNMIYADDEVTGNEWGGFRAQVSGPHFVGVFQSETGRHGYAIDSSYSLIRMEDRDDDNYWDGASIDREPIQYYGGIDYVGDVDYHHLYLREGDAFDIRVDSILINPVIMIEGVEAYFEEEIDDYDSGGGIFGVSPRLVFKAPHTGEFLLMVEDLNPDSVGFGGYVLTITPAGEDSPAPVAIAPTATPIVVNGHEMRRFESDRHQFTLLYPAFYQEVEEYLGQPCLAHSTCFSAGPSFLTINEEDVGDEAQSAAEVVDAMLQTFTFLDPDLDVINRQPIISDSGQSGEMVEYKLNLFGQFEFWTVSCIFLDGDTAIGIVYEFLDFEELPEEAHELIQNSCSSFELTR